MTIAIDTRVCCVARTEHVQKSPLALVHLSALLLDAFRRQPRRLFETGHQPRWFERQARYDGPRPFDIGPFPIPGPRRWAISEGK